MSSGGSFVAGAPGPSPVTPPGVAPQLVASTGINGFPLVNGTPTILSWTAPNDGNLHRVNVFCTLQIAVSQTGGALGIAISGTGPMGGNRTWLVGNNAGPNFAYANASQFMVGPGQTFSLNQNSAQTAGQATAYAELWAI